MLLIKSPNKLMKEYVVRYNNQATIGISTQVYRKPISIIKTQNGQLRGQ